MNIPNNNEVAQATERENIMSSRTHIVVNQETGHIMRWLHSGNWINRQDSDYINELIKNQDAYVVYFKGDKMTQQAPPNKACTNMSRYRPVMHQYKAQTLIN